MTLLLALPALALDFPWACPTFAEPVDAFPYRDPDHGLDSTYAALEDVYASVSTVGCEWIEATTVEDDTTSTERACTLGDVTWTRTTSHRAPWDGSVDERRTTRTVERASGAAWTRLTLVETTSSSRVYDSTATDASYEASWSGEVLDGLPADGWFGVHDGNNNTSSMWQRFRTIDTPACAFASSVTGSYEQTETSVRANGDVVRVVTGWVDACERSISTAEVDGVPFGGVLEDTWAANPVDADRDGYPAGDCDCDDADAGVHVRSPEVAFDGVDQDCDGADLDADGDGYTLDGGAAAPDCDDTDDQIHPTAREIACDGVDQDCDGADLCEEAAADPAPPSAPSHDEPTGCRTPAAFVAFLPLLGARRRARSP